MSSISSFQPSNSNYPTNGYEGTYEEWVQRSARALAERYAAGDQSVIDSMSGATGNIGQPARADFGSGAVSEQTYDFYARYVNAYASSDPYLAQQFGQPPTKKATFAGQDPNSPSQVAAANNAAAAERQASANASAERISAADNASREKIAFAGFANDMAIAQMRDATDRYIAEGNWGVQKYVAELQESGALERLKLELGMRDKELAQRALEEKNRHHENMVNLALEVARYDAELGQEPRNWLAYAAWLGNRDMVVNGLNLAMAADMVPEDVAAAEAANTAGGPGAVAASMSITVQQQQLASGASGGSTSPQSVQGTQPYTVAGVDINSTDYAGIARQLMGMAPGAQTTVPTQQELQAAYDSTNTQNTAQRPQFGSWGGPTTTKQGVEVNAQGHKENYTNFKNLLPVQQEMRLGAVQGVRGKFGVNDFLAEMERSRPKGTTSGAASYG